MATLEPQRTTHDHGDTSDVEIVIAVHDLRRDITRAITSVAGANHTKTVVMCHNLTAGSVQEHLQPMLADPRIAALVEFVEHHDDIPSPSGPFNAGIARSNARWVGIMGSDDELQPGAVSHWKRKGEALAGSAVVAKVLRATPQPGARMPLVRSPMLRPQRPAILDAVKDRLYYRSAPLGIMSTEFLQRNRVELLEGAKSGGDLPFVAQLWSGGKIVNGLGGPAYVEHADAPVRVTHDPKPVAVELMALQWTLTHVWPNLTAHQQTALAVKLLRRNLMDTLYLRAGGAGLTMADQEALATVVERIERKNPAAFRLISRAHHRIFQHILDGEWQLVPQAYRGLGSPLHPAMLLPAQWNKVGHSQAPLRVAAAAALLGVGLDQRKIT